MHRASLLRALCIIAGAARGQAKSRCTKCMYVPSSPSPPSGQSHDQLAHEIIRSMIGVWIVLKVTRHRIIRHVATQPTERVAFRICSSTRLQAQLTDTLAGLPPCLCTELLPHHLALPLPVAVAAHPPPWHLSTWCCLPVFVATTFLLAAVRAGHRGPMYQLRPRVALPVGAAGLHARPFPSAFTPILSVLGRPAPPPHSVPRFHPPPLHPLPPCSSCGRRHDCPPSTSAHTPLHLCGRCIPAAGGLGRTPSGGQPRAHCRP